MSGKWAYFKHFARIWREGADLLFPPQCISCRTREPLFETAAFCRRCRDEMYDPLSFALPGGAAPAFTAGYYKEKMSDLIVRAKFRADPLAVPPLVHLITDTAHFTRHPIDAVTCIPGTPRRIRQRGIHLPGLLARRLSGTLNVRYGKSLLRRVKQVPPQTGLPREKRLANVDGAFEAGPAAEGLRILVVDDVITTGATAAAAARALLGAGAAEVTCVAVARTPE